MKVDITLLCPVCSVYKFTKVSRELQKFGILVRKNESEFKNFLSVKRLVGGGTARNPCIFWSGILICPLLRRNPRKTTDVLKSAAF